MAEGAGEDGQRDAEFGGCSGREGRGGVGGWW